MSKPYNTISTYRIQFNKEFTFDHFRKIIPYLAMLGVRTVYASPVFQASPGSMHGYDGTDPNSINTEIGTEEQLKDITQELQQHEVRWLQDIVPNHLSYDEHNAWLMDVLEKGPVSEYADFFDIDWQHPKYGEKLMVPFPGSPLEEKLKKELPAAEHYVLTPWQETDKSINYRRFFTVNSLICTNIHHTHVFKRYHELIRKLVNEKVFAGLRVDHVDGLADPKTYLENLRSLAGDEGYIIVEKILEPNEPLPDNWPIQGNSGYDFLGMINNLFTNRKSEQPLTNFYAKLTGDTTPVSEQIRQKKSYILHNHMGGELDNLCRLYKNCGLADDLTEQDIRKCVSEYLVSCPVYRYYGKDVPVMDRDKGKDPAAVQKFYGRAMQFTGPLMAKGVEDTLMYTYNRFVGHNEVGDSPETYGYSPGVFHDMMEERMSKWPMSMNGTSTHDTKRGEDARARLNVITDLHAEWISLVEKWTSMNMPLKKSSAPDANDEYFIYQTILATYPATENEENTFGSRLNEYLQKALREAKTHSNWSEPDSDYEEGCKAFATALLDKNSAFWKNFHPFLRKATDLGMINSFAQLVLKFTCPGIPDLYQGTELWDLSMVDPDNRRPVNYSLREKMLTNEKHLHEFWATRNDGQIKLMLLKKLIHIRNRFAEFFVTANYKRLNVTGTFAENVFAFMREKDDIRIISVVPLHFADVSDGEVHELTGHDWKDTAIEIDADGDATWEDLLNGGLTNKNGSLNVQELFATFPAALWMCDK